MTMVLILNVVGIVMIIAAIVLTLPWRKFLENKFGDNPVNARVYIQFGNKYIPVDGKLKIARVNSASYRYRWLGKTHTVVVPDNYPKIMLHGKLYIHVVAGSLIASLPGKLDEKVFGQYEYDTLVTSGIAVDVVNSLTGKKMIPWIVLIIIAIVAVAGYFLYQNMNSRVDNIVPVTANKTNIEKPPPIQIIP